MKTLSIVVPVYFNEGSLPDLFSKLLYIEQLLNQQDMLLELIFVDDGSQDNSLNLLRQFVITRPGSKVIKLSRNFGAISAVKTGLNYITGDCFLFLAADLQDPPELIPEMISRWKNGSKYIICERTDRQDPLGSKIFSAVYYKLLRKFVMASYPKNGFDLALMDAQLLPYLKDSGKHINFPLFPFWLGFTPEKIPYVRVAREHGKSRWTFGKKWKLLIDSIFSFSFAPVRLISAIGLIVSLGSFAYGTVVVLSALFGKVEVPGFATLATLVSFLLGLIIVMLGVMSEYIWRIFDEVNRHPHAVIEEEIL
ncbi:MULTISPECIES: glycosyltransferase family 2 protein [Gammaproteobacteria]|jgi:Glycosyltransferases involved in cell wall biogenesis|uniref:Glycosyl transferase n=1 Tax=Pseudomonas lini TaxID=163011 RepID=A0A423I8B9_9PSED|nr:MULTISPECIES: glycosyltransferase family 2 protein [Gammaproteobacteria]MBK5301888.1 glycosyltransferase family 2 protein [Bacillus sp. TH86]MBK5321657.1 glycosyltransferase family 2 protein [Bacillus sp. TH59]MBK5336607.1 glycosyltransferase family 2 protein [Bacillus sp. TH57]MBK5310672.1 glycosyltransferase family 2 protein [Pseudomonas sp. TH71]MBK5316154.1 glycosyltransferase family 2 protein [Erwinia sp. TH79]